MTLKEKINTGHLSLTIPNDINDFFENPLFEKERKEIVDSYEKQHVEVDYYTNAASVSPEKDFANPISFLEPLISKYHIDELRIESIEPTWNPGCLSDLLVSKIVIEGSVKTIPDCFFRDMRALKGVVLENGLEEIGDEAFAGCRSLKEIFIPSTISKIGKNIFGNCIFLGSIKVDPKNSKYSSFDSNVIVEKGKMQIVQGCSSSSFIEGIKSIGYRAFWKFPLLKEIRLPESLEDICEEAFYGCISLTEINLPKSLKYIGQCAFSEINDNAAVCYGGSINEYKKILMGAPFKKVICNDGNFESCFHALATFQH